MNRTAQNNNDKSAADKDSRAMILSCIRAGLPAPEPLPDVPLYRWPGDPVDNFISKLEAFDGSAERFATRRDALSWLAKQSDMDDAVNIIYSSADGVGSNISEESIADPHNAHVIDTCVTESRLGVGETGSVWVTDESLRHAACALMSRHLYVLLDSTRIVGGIHEAYAALHLAGHAYGSFYTGPSATADIEAVHITGAQGPLALTVLLYDRPE